MSERFFITTPIYYVNDEAHIGHAYTTILADVLRRFHRLFGKETFLLAGVDEHGQKVEQAAAQAGISPQEHCDQMAPRFRALWDQLDITYDDFIRTTEERHQRVVRDVLQRLWDQGQIYSDTYQGWYCLYEERFWTEKDLNEGLCPECQRPVTQIEEKNYFFKMSQYQSWLVDHIQNNPNFIRPQSRRNEILGFLRQPLGDLCISRPKQRLSWGVEFPFDPDYVTYVWFDALLNYISAPLDRGGEAELGKWWPSSHHLIGKDILTTHCVYWPTMLKAAGYDPPYCIIAHGWWLLEESKMSKSKGNVVKPLPLIEKYGLDAFRYFLVREMALGSDSNFSEKALVERLNSDLANDFGNLLNRTMKLLQKYFQGRIPEPGGNREPLDLELAELGQQTIGTVRTLVEDFKLHAALEETLQLVRRANKYIDQSAPWKTAQQGDLPRTATILWHVLEVLRLSASILSPVIPGKVAALFAQLGLDPSQQIRLEWGCLPSGGQTGESQVLFPRQEFSEDEAPPAPAEAEKPEPVFASIDDFRKLELRVGKVLQAEKIPKADRLLKLLVDLGSEQRQIVAGIAAHYQPEALIGQKIIVIANLQPAKIRGIESQGMLLAAQQDGVFSVLSLLNPEVPEGARVS